ncbi:unnamed protein product [Adineta steineri]|uniref:Uncharacterized protein n=1 Tax=Adineta steineri TaxID=433720 RepID=A0A814G8Z0_9BILA|nr:unnamed protein product [Adineta steineri]CAF1583650.1 unnamed protein product [Adineta steineri]
MQEPSVPENQPKKENILSTKCRFLLWSCILIQISIIIGVIATVIFSRYQSPFSSINIKYDIGNINFL